MSLVCVNAFSCQSPPSYPYNAQDLSEVLRKTRLEHAEKVRPEHFR